MAKTEVVRQMKEELCYCGPPKERDESAGYKVGGKRRRATRAHVHTHAHTRTRARLESGRQSTAVITTAAVL